jgi:hypothetical protein
VSERDSAEAAGGRPDLGPARPSCGSCSLCCTVLRVDELAKLAGSPCAHQREAGGCAIHPTRPSVCRAYRCLWLRGAFAEADRPDRLGAVVDFAPDGAGIRLAIEEVAAGTFDRSPRLQAIAASYRGTMPVRIASAERVLDPDRPFRLLSPDGSDHRIAGDWIETLEDGVVVARRRASRPIRFARRLRARIQRWRLRGYRPGGAVFEEEK